jgi:small-conductance mechanosensitive channel
MAFLASFGDSGMNLELGVWINDPQNGQLNLRSALNRKILARFRENGIRISYPQREVRVLPAEAGTPQPPVPPSVGASS